MYLTKSVNRLLNMNQINTIFNCVKEIYDFHCFEMLIEFDMRYSNFYRLNQPHKALICDSLTKHINKIRLYESHLNNLKESISCLDSVCETQPQVKSSLETIDQNVILKTTSLLTIKKRSFKQNVYA